MKITKEIRLAIVLFLSSASLVFAAGLINSGKPVPVIGDDEPSAIFLAGAIVKAEIKELVADGVIGKLKKDAKAELILDRSQSYLEYARQLAKTLSALSPAEQNVIWYGS